MDGYSHVVVVMSILLGMSITQLARGVAQTYRTRKRVKPYWLHSAWMALLVLLSFVLWWTYWGYRGIADWDFFRFVLYLAPTTVFYFVASIAFPDPTDPVTDLREYFFANRVGFFGTLALYGVMAGITAVVVRGLPAFDSSNGVRAGMVALLLIGARTDSERIHTILVVLTAVLLLLYIGLFHFRLS